MVADRIERVAAIGEHRLAGPERQAQPGMVQRLALGGHVAAPQGAGAAVDGERKASASVAGVGQSTYPRFVLR